MAYTMPLPNRITTYKVLMSLLEMTTNLYHVYLMGKTLITKSTDGVWSLPHITSLLNGFLGPETKQLITSPDWYHLQAHQFTC